jgi:hypothetical protein
MAIAIAPYGSLVRRTYFSPLRDVDLMVVFAAGRQPWEAGADNWHAAVVWLRGQIERGLSRAVRPEGELAVAHAMNHSVKCWFEDPSVPGAFPVDVVPAVPHPAGGVRIPERATGRWLRTNPAVLDALVARRLGADPRFGSLLSVIKRCNHLHGRPLTGVALDVIAVEHLDTELSRPLAVAQFFRDARRALSRGVVDPAGLCGELCPDVEREQADRFLELAVATSAEALTAARAGAAERASAIWLGLLAGAAARPAADGGIAAAAELCVSS